MKKLGAFGSDLGAVACFFEQPWSRLSPALPETAQAWLLNEAAFSLQALGRLTDALEPMRAGLEMRVRQENWKQAAISASNLSELELTLGDLAGAVELAGQSVNYADRSGGAFQRMTERITHADALHQVGLRTEAEALFIEAEKMQAERQSGYPLLYSLQGFKYCNLLLAVPERAAWQQMQEPGLRIRDSGLVKVCRDVSERAAQTLQWAENNNLSLLDIAINHLTQGRAAFYEAILKNSALKISHSELDQDVGGLRNAGQQQYLPLGLLTRAWLRSIEGKRIGSESAQADLDEAWEIAERGPMPLYMADIHLHRARLFFRETPYPWSNADDTPRSAKDDLAEARRLINKHGYWRRREELEDAESAIGK